MCPIPAAGFVQRLAMYVRSDRAAADIAAYFDESGDPKTSYAGRHFERLAGGGDRPDRAHCITAEDLIAVQTLSVTVPPETSVQLLEGHLGLAVNRHLRDVSTPVSLLDPRSGAHLADGSPADHCWRLLVSGDAPGIGATIAGKLLARKRPQLIPVYDDVVRCALGQPSHFWISLHCALVDNPDLAVELAALRAHAPPYVSVIRVLDVVVWMAHEKEHKTRCHAERVSPPEIADDFTSVPDPRATRTEPTPHYGTGIAALDAVTGGGLKPR